MISQNGVENGANSYLQWKNIKRCLKKSKYSSAANWQKPRSAVLKIDTDDIRAKYKPDILHSSNWCYNLAMIIYLKLLFKKSVWADKLLGTYGDGFPNQFAA